MNWISKIFSREAGGFIDSASKAVKRFVTTDSDRMELMNELEEILQKRDSEVEQTIRAELTAKAKIIEAELNQGDNYTKRARPTVVYAGLVFIGINYMVFPIIGRIMVACGVDGMDMSPLELPVEFWAAWGGICMTWVIGRSAEKRGTRNKLTGAITGNQPKTSLLD